MKRSVRNLALLAALSTLAVAQPASAVSAPANDAVANAQTITRASGSVNGTTNGATADVGEWKQSDISPTVWYRWVAPASAWVSFDTCTPTGQWFDTVVAIFSFTTPGDWTGGWTRLSSNDDRCPGNRSVTMMPVTVGTTYYIQVSGYNDTDFGPFRLMWRMGLTSSEVLAFLSAPSCDPTITPRDARRGCAPERGRR